MPFINFYKKELLCQKWCGVWTFELGGNFSHLAATDQENRKLWEEQ